MGWTVLLALAPGLASRADEPAAAMATAPSLVAPSTIDQGAAEPGRVTLPAGPAVHLVAAPGLLDPPALVDGTWSARYRPPDPAEPGALLLHAGPAWPSPSSPCGGTWAVASRSTLATLEIRTKPRAHVRVMIGGNLAGDGVADARGVAHVKAMVGPEDETYEVEAVDPLGNQNIRRLGLPPLIMAPPLVALVCSEAVEVGQSLFVEIGAVDHHGRPAPVTLELPRGLRAVPQPLATTEAPYVSRHRIFVTEDAPAGPTLVRAHSGAAVADLRFAVLPRPVPIAQVIPAATTVPAGLVHHVARPRHGFGLSVDAGGSSNLGEQLGVAAAVAAYLRLGVLEQRLRPRLLLGLHQLWGGTRAGASAAVEVLVVPLELGVGATLLRSGPWEADLEIGGGVALARVSAAASTTFAAASTQRFAPSLSAGLVLRRRFGRGAIVARAWWRQVFTGGDASAVETQDDRGFVGLALGGELDVK